MSLWRREAKPPPEPAKVCGDWRYVQCGLPPHGDDVRHRKDGANGGWVEWTATTNEATGVVTVNFFFHPGAPTE